jgi:hypothetical protein
MATTTNYSWSTPDDTALVKDGAAAIRTLGSSADTTVKALNPGTTAGDVDYYTTSTAKARLGIGTAGQVLTVNSGATAPEWASASGADALLNGEYATYYVRTSGLALGTGIITEDVTWFAPIFLSAGSFDRIACRTGSSHTGVSTVRLGLYNASKTTGKPSTVVFDAGTVNCNASSTKFEITIAETVASNWYYLAFNAQTVTGTAQFQTIGSATNGNFQGILGMYSDVTDNSAAVFYSETGITGVFATVGTLVAPTTGGSCPAIHLRIS